MAGLDIEEDTTVSLQDVLEEDKHLEDTANAVLGDSDDTKCSYSKVQSPPLAHINSYYSTIGVCWSPSPICMWYVCEQ